MEGLRDVRYIRAGVGSHNSNDTLTVSALAVIAMCVVTAAHEALGHGGACLLLGGHIVLLTSSLFHCDLHSGWIDAAGPAGNLLAGLVAWIARKASPPGFARTRLLLLLVTAFSVFWEGGYLMRAMIVRDGDLYFFTRFLSGEPSLLVRAVGFVVGLAIYLLSARIAAQALGEMFDTREARKLARIAWVTATAAAALAALLYRGQALWPNVHDAVLEIGLASFPLLFIPRESDAAARVRAIIGHSYAFIVTAAIVFAIFAATLGRGVIA